MAKEIKKPAKTTTPVQTAAAKKPATAKPVKQTESGKSAATKPAGKLDAMTQRILDTFAQISAIPRGSGNEEQIRHFLIDWARNNKFLYITDRVGNLIIKIAASKGMEKHATIVLQGHLDMVCEKTPDSDHDFL
jgi:hypothetical protein